MRVMLDSNVLARATPGRNSPARQLVTIITSQSDHVLVASEYLLQELSRVLRYERLRRIHQCDDTTIDDFVALIEQAAELVSLPPGPVDAIVPNDPDDDPILATAIAGRAEVLCTLDRDLRNDQVKDYCGQFHLRILTDVELLAELRLPQNRA